MSEHRFGCPKCGGKPIVEWNLVPTAYRVGSWTEDGEPDLYDGREDSADAVELCGERPYQCRACNHEFDEPKRLTIAKAKGEA